MFQTWLQMSLLHAAYSYRSHRYGLQLPSIAVSESRRISNLAARHSPATQLDPQLVETPITLSVHRTQSPLTSALVRQVLVALIRTWCSGTSRLRGWQVRENSWERSERRNMTPGYQEADRMGTSQAEVFPVSHNLFAHYPEAKRLWIRCYRTFAGIEPWLELQ